MNRRDALKTMAGALAAKDDAPVETQYRDLSSLGFPGYQVGSDGSVWSRLAREGDGHGGFRTILGKSWKRLKARSAGRRRNHYYVALYRDGKSVNRYVHRLVLEAFVGLQPLGMEACHNDGDSANNCLENLRWDTHHANCQDSFRHGVLVRGARHHNCSINVETARQVKSLIRQGLSSNKISAALGISRSIVTSIKAGKAWRYVE